MKTTMTSQDELFFHKLTKIRSNGADLFGKHFLRGMWDGIVKKYSDQAHFIYKLLQNADDAGATSARFILEKNQLIFAHNGDRLFTVSNPDSCIGGADIRSPAVSPSALPCLPETDQFAVT